MPEEREPETGEKPPEGAEKPGERKPDEAKAPGGKKKLGDKKTAVLVILTAAGVLLAWLSLRKNASTSSTSGPPAGQPGSSALDPSNYPTGNGGSVAGYSPDAYAGLQEMISNLTQQVGTLQTQVQNTTITRPTWYVNPGPAPHGPIGVPTSPHASPGVHSAYFTGGGSLNQHYSLRDEARRLLPAAKRNDPNAVESELRAIVKANPSLRGRTYLLGGHRYRMPA